MSNKECAALWTNGQITIVLPHVVDAYWAIEGNDDEANLMVPPKEANCFVIDAVDGGATFEGDDNWRDDAVSFLRALSLYWETRV